MPEVRQIVIVDDHAMVRKGLIKLVNLFPGYEVMFDASNGKDFISQLMLKKLPDIVLLDITMPEMDGYVTTEWLHSNYPEIKILALSTMDSESAIIKMIKCGANGYVLKDAEPEELQLAFDEIMTRGYFYNELVTKKVMSSVSAFLDPKAPASTFLNLTEREIEFLKYVCTELTYKGIAHKMLLSERTVESYRDALCEKLGINTRIGLAMYAVKNQIVNISDL